MSFAVSKKSVSLALLALCSSMAVAGYWWQEIHPFESTDNAYLKAHISLISPKETGYVADVLFKDNQKVSPGDLLVLIENQDFAAKVAQAEAEVQSITARIQTLESDKRTQAAKISQEVASISSADAELQKTARDLNRISTLADKGVVSAQTRDSAEAAHKQADAQRDRVRSARLEAESQLLSLDTQIEEARARLKSAEAALELARISLNHTRIYAPMAGVIGNRSVQIGQLVQPGAILGYLIPTQDLFVEANFKETQIAQIKPGQRAEIRIDAYPDQAFEGVVDSFAPASGSEFSLLPPENATGNFTKIVRRVPVKILFGPGTDVSRLRPGLSTLVKIKVR